MKLLQRKSRAAARLLAAANLPTDHFIPLFEAETLFAAGKLQKIDTGDIKTLGRVFGAPRSWRQLIHPLPTPYHPDVLAIIAKHEHKGTTNG